MNLSLIGFGAVGRAFARLIATRKPMYPCRITGIHTATHGTVYDRRGIAADPTFGPAADSVGEFLDPSRPEIVVEITTLNPETGEPAISHIREAFLRGAHVVTANKGPIAHAYHELCEEARSAGVEFRFESTCMLYGRAELNLQSCDHRHAARIVEVARTGRGANVGHHGGGPQLRHRRLGLGCEDGGAGQCTVRGSGEAARCGARRYTRHHSGIRAVAGSRS